MNDAYFFPDENPDQPDESQRHDSDREIPWQEPLPLPDNMPAVDPFDEEQMPESLRPWIIDISDLLQCPLDFPAVAAVIVLAGIVGRKIGIRPQRLTDWLVIPNLWGAVIGRPGLMKTPAIQEPLKALYRFEADAKSEFDSARREHEAALIIAKATRKARESDLSKAVKQGGDVQSIAQELQELDPAEPIRRRYLVNDSTVEKLGEVLNENPNGVTVFRDELVGLLKSLDKDGREGARAFYLEAWNGTGRFTYDRIGRGTLDIAAAIVSIVGAIQPGPLSEYVRKLEAGGAGDDGLLQRFQLAVWPDCPTTWRNVDRLPDTDAKQTAFTMFERLDSLEAVALGAERDEDEHVPFLRFDEAAQEQFDEFRSRLETRLRSGTEHPAIESHLAKYRSLVPSLALLFHLADEPDGGPVTEQSVKRSLLWAKYLETHARRIYSSVSLASVGAAHRLAGKIESGEVRDGFSLRDIYHKGWSGLANKQQVSQAVEILADHNWLRVDRVETIGRTASVHRINPRFLKTGEGRH